MPLAEQHVSCNVDVTFFWKLFLYRPALILWANQTQLSKKLFSVSTSYPHIYTINSDLIDHYSTPHIVPYILFHLLPGTPSETPSHIFERSGFLKALQQEQAQGLNHVATQKTIVQGSGR